jgi:hypothetical protein
MKEKRLQLNIFTQVELCSNCCAEAILRLWGVELSISKWFAPLCDKWKVLHSQELSSELLKNQLLLQGREQGEGLTRRESMEDSLC